MQELMLIVTGVPRDRKTHAVADGGAACLRLPWRRTGAALTDAHAALSLRLGRPDLAVLSPAALIAQAAGAADANAWLLSPLHCVAGIDRLHLAADGLLDLPATQWSELCASFGRELGAAGMTLTPFDGRTALLQGAPFGGFATVAADELPGADLRDAQPRGADARRWRALQGEIELWLYEHPVNRLRARAGQPRVTTLWLWGGAPLTALTLAAGQDVAAARPAGWLLAGLGAWARALATLQPGVAVVDDVSSQDLATLAAAHPGRSIGVRLDAAGDLDDVARRWLAPAAQALERGQLVDVTLQHRGAAWRLGRRRWWRRRRDDHGLAELFVASSGALPLR